MCLSSEVSKGMNTLADKVEAIWVPIAIEDLEVNTPLEEKPLCSNQLFFWIVCWYMIRMAWTSLQK